MDWIECNLPWDYQIQDEEYLSLMQKASDIENKISIEVQEKLGIDHEKIHDEVSKLTRYVYDTCEEYSKNNNTSIHEARNILCSTDPKISKYDELREQEDKYYNEMYDHKDNEEFLMLRKQANDSLKPKSFTGRGLNKPGTIIEVIVDGENKQYLMGDINISSGLCNDCSAFDSDTIVKRYKVIWQPNGNSNS